jgi:hypothetical protein
MSCLAVFLLFMYVCCVNFDLFNLKKINYGVYITSASIR